MKTVKAFLEKVKYRYAKLMLLNYDYKKTRLHKDVNKALKSLGVDKNTSIDLWTTRIKEVENAN